MSDPVAAYMAKANVSNLYDPNDPLTPVYKNLVAMYANKIVMANNPSRDNATLIEACLRAKQILIWKKTAGDCPKQSSVSIGTVATGSKIAGSAIGTLGAVGASVNSFAAAGTGLATFGESALAIAGPASLAILPFAIWGAISAHHAQAVAAEQADLCQVGGYVNDNFGQIAAANVDWKTKQQAFTQVASNAVGAAAPVTKGNQGSSTCNAGCMIQNAILALRDLFIQLYAQPPAPAPLSDPLTSLFGQSPAASGPTAVNSQSGAQPSTPLGTPVLVGAGAIGLHYMGAF